jgi:hypothetical protein
MGIVNSVYGCRHVRLPASSMLCLPVSINKVSQATINTLHHAVIIISNGC